MPLHGPLFPGGHGAGYQRDSSPWKAVQNMTTVHLVCGRLGVGKTSLAKGIERERHALRFSLDEWMIHLFGKSSSRDVFSRRVALCMDLMMHLTERLIELGTDVVLDVGFWKRTDRHRARETISRCGGKPILYLLEAPPEVRWQRLRMRNRVSIEGTYRFTRDKFEELESFFDPFGDEEIREAVLLDAEMDEEHLLQEVLDVLTERASH